MQTVRQNEPYNVPLLEFQMRNLGLDHSSLAEVAEISRPTAITVMAGKARTFRALLRVRDALLIKPGYLFKTDLPESQFHRAVLQRETRERRGGRGD